ncbi:hypothetical protein [Micromonospora tulbaghiae]|uniref:hypothetical protein n=1 Tax=Micromonospora tulbaghiae TaxID=479978 RepID=UPI0033EBA4A9
MAEDTSTIEAEQGSATGPDEQASQPDLGDAGKRALQEERRKARDAAKRAADLEARLKDYEDRDKSEAEKTAERLADAEKRASAAEQRALRLEVAAAKGLTPGQAKRLVGATREELEADADDILATFPTAPAVPERKAPKPDPSQGSRGEAGKGGSVAAGMALYQQKHQKTTAT